VIVEVVLHRYIEEEADVGVVEAVVDGAALLAGSHQSGQPKLAKLMAGGRLAGIHRGG
jgi:hypothetical protein